MLLCTISPSFQYTIQVIVAKQEKATIISDEHQRCTATFTVRFHSSVIFASTSQTAASLRKFVKDQQATAWEVSKCMKIQAALKLPSWVKLSQVAFWCDSTISSLLLSTSSSRCLSFQPGPRSGHTVATVHQKRHGRKLAAWKVVGFHDLDDLGLYCDTHTTLILYLYYAIQKCHCKSRTWRTEIRGSKLAIVFHIVALYPTWSLMVVLCECLGA